MNFDPIQMQGIIRYANRNRIKNEDLAQHSFSVAYYCFEIAIQYNIPDNIRNEAIAMSIIHDIGECYTSDLPHDVKYENPELKKLCDKLEIKFVDSLNPQVTRLWHKLEDNKDSIQYLMVKLADSMSVRSYVDRELTLGNRDNIMAEISQNIDGRIDMFSKKLLEKVVEYNANK